MIFPPMRGRAFARPFLLETACFRQYPLLFAPCKNAGVGVYCKYSIVYLFSERSLVL